MLLECREELSRCKAQLREVVSSVDQVKEENKLVIPHVLPAAMFMS